MRERPMRHYQDYHGTRCGWLGGDIFVEASELAGLPTKELSGGTSVEVFGEKFPVRSGAESERISEIVPFAQIRVSGEISFVSGVLRGSTPEEVIASVRAMISYTRKRGSGIP